MGQKVIIRLR